MPAHEAETPAPLPTAIVLAAGRSTRMGQQNKLLLPFGQQTVIAAVAETVCAVDVGEVLVVTGHEPDLVRAALQGLPVRFIHNPAYETGMASSLRAGVEAASPSAVGYLICLGDMPGLKQETIRRVLGMFRAQPGTASPIVIATAQGRRGHPVLFARAYRDALLALQGDVGARALIQQHAAHIVDVAVADEGVHDDIDTLERYRHVLGKHRSS